MEVKRRVGCIFGALCCCQTLFLGYWLQKASYNDSNGGFLDPIEDNLPAAVNVATQNSLPGGLNTLNGIARNSLPGGPKTQPRPKLTNRQLRRFIVVPEHKLLFCYVEKVGCSMFNHLFRMLRLSIPEVARNSEEAAFQANATWFRNTPEHHNLTKRDLEDIMVNPDWTKAVFFRDPVTRFLSAFRSKCEEGHDTGKDARACKKYFGRSSLSFDEALAAIKSGQVGVNVHYEAASNFCGGLGSTIDYYDFVHELDPETSPLHVEALLRKIGVDTKLAHSLVDSVVRSGGTNLEKDKKIAAQMGVELNFGQTQNVSHNTNSAKELCKYYNTADKLRLIEELYSIDYEVFQLSPRKLNCAPLETGGHTGNDDACIIAEALKYNPLRISSYFPLDSVLFPSRAVPHVSSVLCAAGHDGDDVPERRATALMSKTSVRTVFAFKVARTGSTFFTKVITNTMNETLRPTSMFWEPFAGSRCRGSSTTYQESSLRELLTHRCRRVDKCYPDKQCQESPPANEYGDPVFITAANPRFFNFEEMDWHQVLKDVPEPRIFSLRRTNLVLMGYSKFHHGGCAVDESSKAILPENSDFTFDTMLRCVEHYAMGDQEISSSVAFQAASSAGTIPFLVVYEDVTSNGPLVQQKMVQYLGLGNVTSSNMFMDNASTKKEHSKPFCEYSDVNCDELKEGLKSSEHYPCLWKQLTKAGEGLPWSVPMLEDGTINIRGDCHPLEPLSELHTVRSFDELYQLPNMNK